MDYERLRPLLACPECRSALRDEPDALACARCDRTWPVIDGVPILLAGGSAAVGEAGDAFFHRPDSLDNLKRRFPWLRILALPNPAIPSDRPRETKRVFAEEVLGGTGLVLNLGSGVHKSYANPNLVNLDIARHENVDVVGDGMALPILDGVFDGVVLDAVLEHVPDPWRLADEAFRVLKPGGFVLVHAPFLYPYHGAPHDYFRYTDAGLRRVFRAFDEVECDTDHLPTRALQETLRAYAGIFSDRRAPAFAFRFVTAWVAWPLKLWDFYLRGKSKSHVVVTGFSYLGRKPREGPAAT